MFTSIDKALADGGSTRVGFAAHNGHGFVAIGKLLIDSIYKLDRPVIVAYVMLVTFIFVMINLVVDLLYAVLDPRVQLQEAQ